MLVSPPSRQRAGAHAKGRLPADHAGAPKFPLKAIHNELPAAAHGEGRNANCPRATFVAGAAQPGYWIPATLRCFSPPVWQEIQYLPEVGAVNASGISLKLEGKGPEEAWGCFA
jgi:hypothetical protein